MKKAILIALCIAALALTGCDRKETSDAIVYAPTEAPVFEPRMAEIDLTGMSATMAYAYVFNMINAPEAFIGQRFRIRGIYDEGIWAPTNQTLRYIVIEDATACCAQGLEFILTDKSAVTPQPGDVIEINGVLETYAEEGLLYIRINADQITLIAQDRGLIGTD